MRLSPSLRKARTLCIVAAVSTLSLLAQQAHASLISMDTRYSNSGSLATANAYQTLIDGLAASAPTSGYGSTTLASFDSVSNQSVFGANSNIAFRYTVDFGTQNSGIWNFRIGPDFGHGGAVFLDGTLVGFQANNMWWAGSYATTSQDFEFLANLTTGNHRLQIYGLEDCCDGSQQAQFKAAGATAYTSFSSTDGNNVLRVPEPGTLSLLTAAAVALVSRRRQAR